MLVSYMHPRPRLSRLSYLGRPLIGVLSQPSNKPTSTSQFFLSNGQVVTVPTGDLFSLVNNGTSDRDPSGEFTFHDVEMRHFSLLFSDYWLCSSRLQMFSV
jgi:hypothetical protein